MVKIEVVACDNDRKVPAQTYTITSSDGRSVSRDLCVTCAKPFEALLPEREEDPEPAVRIEDVPEPEPAKVAAPRVTPEKKVAPVKKATPEKAAAKKTTPRRRQAKVVSLEEIEAKKQS